MQVVRGLSISGTAAAKRVRTTRIGVIGQEVQRVVAYGHLEKRCAAAGRRHSFQDRFGNEGVHVVAAGDMVSGPPTFEIFPEAACDYFYKVINAQFTLVTNSRGKATELILDQSALDQHAKQIE